MSAGAFPAVMRYGRWRLGTRNVGESDDANDDRTYNGILGSRRTEYGNLAKNRSQNERPNNKYGGYDANHELLHASTPS